MTIPECDEDALAFLAHELRNPLGLIRSVVARLERATSDPEAVGEACVLIDRQVTQLAALVDELAAVGRKAAPLVSRTPIDLRLLVSETVAAVRGLAEERGLIMSTRLGAMPLYVNADPARLTQVLTNLLMNAVKCTDAGGSICVMTAWGARQIELRVRDTGCGIPPEMLLTVFDPFVRVGSGSVDGSGIGLAVARQLIAAHDGTIEAKSAGTGRGTEVIVRLPTHVIRRSPDERPGAVPVWPQTTAREAVPSRRILVVDDYESAAASLARWLTIVGHQVAVAHDGRTAIDEALRFGPEIVLLDLALPVLPGYEVARRLRAETTLGDLVIVAMSGSDPHRELPGVTAADLAVFDHQLTKPIDTDDLLSLIEASAARPA